MADNSEFHKSWDDFLSVMGLVLINWQRVEDAHYLLFNKMAEVANEDICSILYFSPPSFESRRALVSRIAQVYLPQEFRNAWNKLDKRLERGGTQRGSVAHYSLDIEIIPDPTPGSKEWLMGAPHLAPSRNNKVDELRGRVRTKEKHVITIPKMRGFCSSFHILSEDLKAFILKIPDKPPALPTARILAALLGPKWKRELRPPRPNNDPSGAQPADQKPRA